MAKHKDQEQLFEEKAARILRYLKKDKRQGFLPRPFFIEMTGSPDAGKSTTIRELYTFLRRYDFTVYIPQEGAEVIQHIPRTTPEYNIRTGMYALNILLDESNKNTYDIVILDRGIYDAYVWMRYWQTKGQLTDEQARMYQQFFLSPLWKDRIDIAYFVTCDPAVAMERALRIAATSRLGHSTNPESIQKSIDRHKAAYAELSAENPQLLLTDTSLLAEDKMIELFTSTTLSKLEQKIKTTKTNGS